MRMVIVILSMDRITFIELNHGENKLFLRTIWGTFSF